MRAYHCGPAALPAPTHARCGAGAMGASEHDNVVEMYLQAAATAPEDPEPRVVLGVLYNLSREYDKAIEW